MRPIRVLSRGTMVNCLRKASGASEITHLTKNITARAANNTKAPSIIMAPCPGKKSPPITKIILKPAATRENKRTTASGFQMFVLAKGLILVDDAGSGIIINKSVDSMARF